MKRLRVAIVGAGLMGRWHAHYASKCGARIAAIVDEQPQRARDLQKKHTNARLYSRLSACLEDREVDVVHVCTHLDSHAELAQEALSAGTHVLLEKPAARSYLQVRDLVETAKRSGSRISCVHQFPFQRGFQELRRKMNQVGEPSRIVFTAFTAGGDRRSADERRTVLLEILPHPVSLLQAIFGKRMGRSRWRVMSFTNDELDISGNLDDIQLGITVSLRNRPTRNELVVFGTTGSAQVNLYHGFCLFESGGLSRASKILQPFRFTGNLLANATTNMLRRVLTWEPAYPGLRELIAAYYHAVCVAGAPLPVTHDEMLQVALFLDRVESQSGDPDKREPFSCDLPSPRA